jgi:pimeloyl-ACP methyl ester carboxylesterase
VKEIKKSGPKAVREALKLLAENGTKVDVVWGAADTWLGSKPPPLSGLKAKVKMVEGAGHFAAEDWAEKVANALLDR